MRLRWPPCRIWHNAIPRVHPLTTRSVLQLLLRLRRRVQLSHSRSLPHLRLRNSLAGPLSDTPQSVRSLRIAAAEIHRAVNRQMRVRKNAAPGSRPCALVFVTLERCFPFDLKHLPGAPIGNQVTGACPGEVNCL
jgi:hypothetical protein